MNMRLRGWPVSVSTIMAPLSVIAGAVTPSCSTYLRMAEYMRPEASAIVTPRASSALSARTVRSPIV